MDELREEIARLLAAALESDCRHAHEMTESHRKHAADMAVSQQRHDDEMAVEVDGRADTAQNMDRALATRDVIGQAKGVIMSTMRVSADDAFALLVTQSQHENRKLIDVATEIAQRSHRR